MTPDPNGIVARVLHADGITDTVGPDPNAMARPSSIGASASGTSLWTTGTYG